MNLVEIFNETEYNLDKEIVEIKKLIEYASKELNQNNLEFNIIFVSNEKIKELNNKCRNINKVTDVLSFALEDYEDILYEDKRLLGDIYISLSKALEQAKEYNHTFLRELAFLSVHGFLHLLGYDHSTEEDEKIMFTKQEEILNGYGITR